MLKNSQYEKAINMYETALKLFSENEKIEKADAYQNLGCSLLAVNRWEEAIEAWKTCLKYNPKQKYVKENLKKVTNECGMAKSPVGLDDFRAFVDFVRYTSIHTCIKLKLYNKVVCVRLVK